MCCLRDAAPAIRSDVAEALGFFDGFWYHVRYTCWHFAKAVLACGHCVCHRPGTSAALRDGHLGSFLHQTPVFCLLFPMQSIHQTEVSQPSSQHKVN